MKLRLALATLLLLLPLQALANVTQVTVTPPEKNVSLTAGHAVVLNWRITRTLAGAPFTLETQTGEFKANANAVDVWGTAPVLSRTVTGNVGVVTITETLVIPQAVLRKALEENSGNFVFLRRFTDNNFATSIIDEVFFHVSGGSGGELGVSALSLEFSDGSSVATVAVDSELTARARLDTNGAGRLEAMWEVNDSGTAGSGFFRALRTVIQSTAGQRTITLVSPPLPTSRTGRMEVRLRIIAPVPGFEPPTLTYFVNGSAPALASVLAPLSVSTPQAGAVLGSDTSFSWSPVANAAGYILEFLPAEGSGGALARVMLDAGQTSTTLSALSHSQLAGASSCRWRVIAFDAGGAPVAASRPEILRISATN